ncbi:hypothetical protein BCD67_16065 [Oscillatoriales cyanobacterium USR001]|nr:hypothetical protein BCD67_16065 [Oscillatoriales cyanobacterium USR001]
MAHYRFSLFLLTCIVCLIFVPSRDEGDRDRIVMGLYNKNPASVGATSGERGSFLDQFRLHRHDLMEIWGNTKTRRHKEREEGKIISRLPRMLFAIAPVSAQESSPKTQKPSPNPKKQKAKPSSSRIPKPLNSIIQVLNRQKVLLLLSLAAVLVTGASVFVLLKLLDNGEGEKLKSKQAIAPKQTPPNNQPKKQNFQENTSSELNLDPDSSLIFNAADIASQSVIPSSNPEVLSPENYNNGYIETDLSRLEKINSTEQLVNNIPDIVVGETSHLPQINIIDRLIKDLADPNPAKRHKAIWELGDRGDSRAVKPLLNLLLESDSNQHSLILSSLSEIGIKTIKPMNRAWVISLQNENPEVRKNAIRDLTRIYELVNQISHLLKRAKDDPDPEVQETARWALNQLNRESSTVNREQS